MGTRNDDISLILAKAKKQGFLPDVKDSELDILEVEAKSLFGDDSIIAGGGTAKRIIANKGRNSTGAFTTTNVNNQSKTDRTKHTVRAEANSLQLSYCNVGINAVGANSYTLGAAIEVNGVVYPLTFGGQARTTVAPGAFALSDVLTLPAPVRKNQDIFIRTYAGVSTIGQKYPASTGYYLVTTRQEATTAGVTGADLTVAGSTLTGLTMTNGVGLVPLGIIGVASADTKSLGIFGDSISIGWNDNLWGTTLTGGFLERFAETNNLPFTNYGLGGDSFFKMNPQAQRDMRYGPELESHSHGICEYGVNDIPVRTITQLKAEAISFWNYISGRGVKLLQTTITPYTDSTDSWATTGNQTVKAFEAVRTQFNDWIRDGAPITSGVGAATYAFTNNTVRMGDTGHPLIGYFEVADTMETARNSGIWKAGYTADGLHPNTTTAQKEMEAAIDIKKLV